MLKNKLSIQIYGKMFLWKPFPATDLWKQTWKSIQYFWTQRIKLWFKSN